MRVFFTDGACSGNPGPGGFGVIGIEGDKINYLHQEQCDNTTNNREEMKAILHAFEYACNNYRFETVLIYSDSAYCVNMINDWIWTWAKNGWKNSKKKTVENLDLVQKIFEYLNMEFFPCEVIKISGHNGDIGNELADALATFNDNKFIKIFSENDLRYNEFVNFKKLCYNNINKNEKIYYDEDLNPGWSGLE